METALRNLAVYLKFRKKSNYFKNKTARIYFFTGRNKRLLLLLLLQRGFIQFFSYRFDRNMFVLKFTFQIKGLKTN